MPARACDVMLLFCGIVLVFVRPSCKSVYTIPMLSQLPGVYSTGLGRGIRPTQRSPDPVQDTKDVNFRLPCLRESAVISYPVQDWTKHYRIQNNKKIHKFAFSPISMKRTKSAKMMWSKGEKRKRFPGKTLFNWTQKCEIVYPVQDREPWNDTLTCRTSLYRNYMGVLPRLNS